MNLTFRLTWNNLPPLSMAAALLAGAPPALAQLPTGAQVAAGAATVSTGAGTLTVKQSSAALVLNWQSFNIGAGETVNFVQPSASAVALNRVTGADASAIYGKLNANGQLFLVNPNGILFGKGAQVNVGGLVASTLGIGDADFLAGRRSFGAPGARGGDVANAGSITADGGYIALLGARVSNQGTLQATLGTVALAAGQEATLDFAGDRLLSVQVTRGALDALAENGQLIRADGGTVVLTAKAADQLLAGVVNNSGLIQARRLDQHGGVITLLGDMAVGQVNLDGRLDASAPNGGDGGFIETSAARVRVADGARVDTSAAAGKFGTWLVDPHDYTVAAQGGDISGATLSANLGSANVVLQSGAGATGGAGDVNVNDAVRWSANTTLTLTASNNVNVNANITAAGASAGLVIAPNSANSGEAASGSGSFRLGTGAVIGLPNVAVDARDALVIGGTAYTVINSVGAAGDVLARTLQGVGADLAGHYALGSDLDATATAAWNSRAGFAPLGNSGTAFSGVFDGLGHTIANLTVNRPGADYAGLFGQVGAGGVVRNVGLAGGSVAGRSQVGALAGANDGVLANVHASTTVSAANDAGGLVGANSGTLDGAWASGAVQSSGVESGGLVGGNFGALRNAYATGAVAGTASVGGLVGANYGSIASAYATGTASGTSQVGGLVGLNTASVNAAYASGAVAGGANTGALVGKNIGTLAATYWNSDVKALGVGSGAAAGATGLTTTAMRKASSFAGFNFSGAGAPGWVVVDEDGTLNNAGGAAGATTPLLLAEYATNIGNAHQLQLMALAPTASYTLAADINAAATGSGKDVWGAKGFAPVGNLALPFSGSLDGQSHAIQGLTIAAPAASYVGLFGVADGATLRNLGLDGGSISGGKFTGALAGTSNAAIDNVYASAAVSGSSIVGALVGQNEGAISNAYASGDARANTVVGGLVGKNLGSIANAYATGVVSGGTAGALVGVNVNGTLRDSYWNGDANPVGVNGIDDGASALSAAQLRGQASFAPGWDFQRTWLIYEGQTAPLLRSFLAPLTVTAADARKTYDGQASSANSVAYSRTPGSALLGSVVYGGSAAGAANAGSYAIVPAGLYSTQQGYAINYVAGTLTVAPKSLGVTGSVAAAKVYDGGNAAVLSGGTLTGVVAGDAVTLVQAGRFANVNVGAAIGVLGADTLAGSAAGNYVLVQPAGLAAAITPKQLTVDATVAQARVYDGTREAQLAGGVLVGVVAGDTVRLNQAGVFASKDVGAAVAVQAFASLAGAGAGNYTVLAPQGLSAAITPLTLKVSGTVTGDKIYDGLASTQVAGARVTGVLAGDSVVFAQAGSFADKNAGKAKLLTYSNSLSGADQGNYLLSSSGGSTTATIAPKDLTVVATQAASKTYDATTSVALTASLAGLVAGDSVSLLQSGAFADKNAGVDKLVNYKNSVSGVDAANYKLASAGGTLQATIFAKALAVSGALVASKVYDGTTKAKVSGGVLVGLLGADKVKLSETAAFASKNAGAHVAVTVAATLSGTDARNYTLAAPTGLTAAITPKLITVDAPKVSKKVYDATTAASFVNGKAHGVILGDSIGVVQSAAFADKNAGTGKTVFYASSLSGDDAGNYTIKRIAGTLKSTITAFKLDVGGDTWAADKTYDGTTAATVSGGTIDGVFAHDIVNFAQAGKFNDKRIGERTVTYVNSLSGRDAGNYTLSEKGGKTTAEITE